MHTRSGSADSSLEIRKNPLNIKFSDGSDWIMDKYTDSTFPRGSDPATATGMVKHGVVGAVNNANKRVLKRPESAVIVSSTNKDWDDDDDDGDEIEDEQQQQESVPRYNVFKRPTKPASQRYRPWSVSSDTSSSNESIGQTPIDAEKPSLPPPMRSAVGGHRKCSSDFLADIIKRKKEEKKQHTREKKPMIDHVPSDSEGEFDFVDPSQRGNKRSPEYLYSDQAPQLDSQSETSSSASLNNNENQSPELMGNNQNRIHNDDYLSLELNNSPDMDLTSSFMKTYTNLSLPTHYSELNKHGQDEQQQQPELGRKNTITSTKGFQTQPSELKQTSEKEALFFEKYKQEMSPQMEEDTTNHNNNNALPKRRSMFYEDSIFEEEDTIVDNEEEEKEAQKVMSPVNDSGKPSISSPELSSSSFSDYSSPEQQQKQNDDDADKQPAENKKALPPQSPLIIPVADDKRVPLDHTDRGRLFMKICGVKDISLPVEEDRNPSFQLTLDNGIQCVTTYPLSMKADYTSVDQEFELVVAQDLKLMLTLTGHKQDKKKIKKPANESSSTLASNDDNRVSQSADTSVSSLPNQKTPPSSPSKKKNVFNNLFTSPKKKKQQQQASLTSSSAPKLNSPQQQAPKDPWDKIKGPKGEFARCYVIESQIEDDVYGQARTFSLPCVAEWDTSSGENKKQVVATIQVVMMYIPKVYKQEVLPQSLASCQKVIDRAFHEEPSILSNSGFLSQEGGDCSYWRRRWFELKDGKLIGKHQDSMRFKLEIDIENDPQVRIIDDPEDYASLYGKRTFKIIYSGCPAGITLLADSEENCQRWLMSLACVRSWLWLVTQRLKNKQKYVQQQPSSAQSNEKDETTPPPVIEKDKSNPQQPRTRYRARPEQKKKAMAT